MNGQILFNDLGPHMQAVLDAHEKGTVGGVPVGELRQFLGLGPDTVSFPPRYNIRVSDISGDLWIGPATNFHWTHSSPRINRPIITGALFSSNDGPGVAMKEMFANGFRPATDVEFVSFITLCGVLKKTVVCVGSRGTRPEHEESYMYFQSGRLRTVPVDGPWIGIIYVLGVK